MPRGYYGLRSILCRGKVIILGCVQTDATTPNMVANIGSCCVRVGSGVQTYATTPNNVRTCSASGTREIFLPNGVPFTRFRGSIS